LSIYLHVLAPIYRYVNDDQLAPRCSVLLGVGRAF
jgi:hypothetical protein